MICVGLRHLVYSTAIFRAVLRQGIKIMVSVLLHIETGLTVIAPLNGVLRISRELET
jgi:hypothetical protein